MPYAISFTNPEFLWLTPLALGLAWWWLVQPRPALRFSALSRFAARRGGRATVALGCGAALRSLACCALIVACAGPRRPDLQTRLPAEGIALMMAIDNSGSMGAADVTWNANSPPISRLEAAKRAFKLFIGGGEAPDGTRFEPRPGDAVGLITFAAIPRVECPLTLNHSVLFQVIDALEPRTGVDAGTNIGDSLAEAIARLDGARSNRQAKVLILMSDGEHNIYKEDVPNAQQPGIDRTIRPREAAQLAAALGIRVYTLDTGDDPPPGASPEAVAQRLAGRRTLQAIAEMTGGRSFPAARGDELLAAYREISELEKTRDEAPIYRRYFEYSSWFAGAAFVLLLIAHLLERTLWRVVTSW
ncbi:MAG: VWA domain-containing protein [Gemmataceae bacterium]|nr:VWA domain-containing protein [Gemmata sp.]MDW8198436.1 VWA domain-containing protein [Gemmataceae bacterium]